MKKIAWIILGLLTSFNLFAVSLRAQSNPIYFPYVVNDLQTSTELTLTNTSGRDANISLVAYGDDGNPKIIPQSPLLVPANSQVVVGSSALSSVNGWVLGSSDAPGVLGNLRVSSTNGLAQDTTESAQPEGVIIFPFVAQSGPSTEIAVVNPTGYSTRVSLTVYDKDGRILATNDSPLAPFGMIRGSVASLFGSDKDYTNASHIVARDVPLNIFSQSVNIVGFEVVRGFSRTSEDSSLEKIFARTDWAALVAIPASSGGSSLIFPNVNRDLDWFSLIGLVNLTASPQTVTLSYATATNPNAGTRGFSIPGNGSIRMSAIDLFGPGQDSGSVKVTSGDSLAGFMALGTSSGSALAAAPSQAKGLTEFLFPTVNEGALALTGIALLNDGSTQASADLFLISPQGLTLGHSTELLLPRQRVVRLVRDYFREGLNTAGGYVFVRSSAPIFGMAMAGVPDKILNQFAPQATRSGFTPPPQSLYVIRGKITDNGAGTPVSGVTLTLSRVGNADVTAATDANGEYVFKNVIPGDYTVKPSQSGRMYAPSAPLVRLSTASTTVNFTRDLLPAISSITVVTNDKDAQATAGNNPDAFAVFGTSEVSLKISGSNFVASKTGQPGQKVFFGSRAVPVENVNFVDSKTIFAKLILNSTDILSELAPRGFYGSYDITIGGQSPFDDTRSNALPFYIVPPLPVLTTVVSSLGRAETFARYEIDSPGETLTLTGYGFREGARILFDGRTALNGIEIDTKFISSTQLQAYLPPHALRSGGIYSLRVRNVSQLPEVSGEAVNFQVNNLRPEISSIDPPGPIALVGPGPTPVFIQLRINGSNFHQAATDPAAQDPGTLVGITLKIPDIFPALVPVGGLLQCITINGRTILRVRVFNTAGQPIRGVAVTFKAPGIDTISASGYFLPGAKDAVTVTSDSEGYAPPLTDNSIIFSANPFDGSYVVTASASVDGIPLKAAFNMTNVNPGSSCAGEGRPSVVFVNSHELIVTQYPIVERGTYSIVVANVSPGGGYSSEKEFVVTSGSSSGVPTIRTTDPLSPSSRPSGSGTFDLTVFRDTSTGAPFQADGWVNFGTVRLNRITGDSSPDSMTVLVPSFLIASPGTVPVTVTNPGTSGNTGGTSTRVFFAVTP